MARANTLFALESDAVTDPVAEMPDMVEVETTADAVMAQDSEVAETADDIEEATDASETLSKVQDVAEASVAQGEGLSQSAADMTTVIVESICNRLNIPSTNLIPATEAFGSTNTRLNSTKLALENIKDTIKKIWEGIKRGAKIVFDGITKFFKNLFSATAAIYNAATGIKKAAEQAAKDKKVVSDKENGKILVPASIVSEDLKGSDLFKMLKVHATVTRNFIAPGVVLDEVAKDTEGSQDAKEKVYKALETYFTTVFDTDDISELTHVKPGVTKASIGPFVGHKYFSVTLHKFFFFDDVDKDDGYGSCILSIEQKKVEIGKDGVETDVLTLDEISKTCDDVIKIIAVTKSFDKRFEKWKQQSDNFLTAADKLASAIKDAEADTDGKKKLLAIKRRLFSSTFNTGNSMMTKIPSFNIQLSKVALKFASANLAKYAVPTGASQLLK